jgi:hypothetical protein
VGSAIPPTPLSLFLPRRNVHALRLGRLRMARRVRRFDNPARHRTAVNGFCGSFRSHDASPLPSRLRLRRTVPRLTPDSNTDSLGTLTKPVPHLGLVIAGGNFEAVALAGVRRPHSFPDRDQYRTASGDSPSRFVIALSTARMKLGIPGRMVGDLRPEEREGFEPPIPRRTRCFAHDGIDTNVYASLLCMHGLSPTRLTGILPPRVPRTGG